MTGASPTGKCAVASSNTEFMAETIKCFSPVDGKLYASRPVASKKEIAATFPRLTRRRKNGGASLERARGLLFRRSRCDACYAG